MVKRHPKIPAEILKAKFDELGGDPYKTADFFEEDYYYIKTWLADYGISVNRAILLAHKKEKTAKTNLERYGVDNPFRDVNKMKEAVRKKYGVENVQGLDFVREKIKRTNIERYGVDNPFRDTEKIKDAVKSKYGVENISSLESVKAKKADTMLKNYGYSCFSQVPEIKEKMKKDSLEKYGVEFPTQLNEVKEKRKQSFIKSGGYPWQQHLKPEVIAKYSSKEVLSNFIDSCEQKNTSYIAEKIGISEIYLRQLLQKYDLWDKVSNGRFESNGEAEIKEYLKDIGVNSIKTRKVMPPYEIDLYSEEYKIGIEFNGDYWHCEEQKDENYHLIKSKTAQEKGIFIYHVFEYEWNLKKEIIKSQLSSLFGKNKKIFARKCSAKVVDKITKNTFLEENHLQGKDRSSVCIGLYSGDELVQIMTFGKPRFNKKFDWEIVRFCSKKFLTVVGGAAKLFKYFKDNYGFTSIISYSNNSKGTGRVYSQLGFTQEGETGSGYVWTNFNEVLSRYQCQMKNEVHTMHSKGYRRIYDCGNTRWVYYKEI